MVKDTLSPSCSYSKGKYVLKIKIPLGVFPGMTCLPHWGPELPALASPQGSESRHLPLLATWLSLSLRSVHPAPVSRPQNLRGLRCCGHCGSRSQHLLGTPARDDTLGTKWGAGRRDPTPHSGPACLGVCRVHPESTIPGHTGGCVTLCEGWEGRHLPCVCCTGHPLRSLPILQMRSLRPREVLMGSWQVIRPRMQG